MIKQKFDEPKEELEKEISKQKKGLKELKMHILMEYLN
jgi:hypothetical protein